MTQQQWEMRVKVSNVDRDVQGETGSRDRADQRSSII